VDDGRVDSHATQHWQVAVADGVLYAMAAQRQSTRDGGGLPAARHVDHGIAMPGLPWGLSAETVDGVIYVVGRDAGEHHVQLPELELGLRPGTDTWQSKASMPTARESFDVGVIDGILYAVGGGRVCGVYTCAARSLRSGLRLLGDQGPMPAVRQAHRVASSTASSMWSEAM
jgi:hypothetical protein